MLFFSLNGFPATGKNPTSPHICNTDLRHYLQLVKGTTELKIHCTCKNVQPRQVIVQLKLLYYNKHFSSYKCHTLMQQYLGYIKICLFQKLPDNQNIGSGSISSDVILCCGYFSNQRGCRMLNLLKKKKMKSDKFPGTSLAC